MKYFAVVAAVALCAGCVSVAADEKDELRNKVLGCIKDSGITIENLIDRCGKEVPTEEPEVTSYKNLLSCVYGVFDVIKQTDSGIEINPEKATAFAPPEKKEKILSAVNACTDRAKAKSTTQDAGFELFTCFREHDKEDYTVDCQNLMQKLMEN